MKNTGLIIENEFYLQDSRSYVGNDVLWWAKNGAGYTSDLSKAEVYTRASAVSQHNERESDIPWPKLYIDQKTRPAVDMQYISMVDALSWTGIELKKAAKMIRERHKCRGCGRFMSEYQYYTCYCDNCGDGNQ
jgi:hypothetical protein